MNDIESEILKTIYFTHNYNQRDLALKLNCSVGLINRSICNLKNKNYLTQSFELTDASLSLLDKNKSRNAIILAAGIGLRMTPINKECSKGMLEVQNTSLIENIINHLLESNVNNIYIVVGYMKEQYEYLIDKYNVKLISNNRYMETNNAYSLYLARNYLDNSYIIPCDIWIENNPFNTYEINSWYIIDSNIKVKSQFKILNNREIRYTNQSAYYPKAIGIAYLNNRDSKMIKQYFRSIDEEKFYLKHYYWENIILEDLKIKIYSRKIEGKIEEINTFEDLRNLDSESPSLKTDIINIILNTLNINIFDIYNITLSKKGMTNRSFLFQTKKDKYIMRIPGEGTDQLINRNQEYDVYQTIHSLGISDEVLYFNRENGYKLTRFINNSRSCDAYHKDDLELCMNLLRKFHNSQLTVNHYFDLYKKIEFYERLRGNKSLYTDYEETKQKIYGLESIIDSIPKQISLTHIDAVPDNFLIYEEEATMKAKLIDWEYAAMQDCHVDIAMFCIYSLYDKLHVDQLIDIYFESQCSKEIRLKIYCYIAICGLLWSNWCEYKYHLGIEFGEYSLAQYRYAKEYSNYAIQFIKENHLCIK